MESYITFAYLGNKIRLINKYSLTRYVSGIFWLHSDFLVECSMLCNKGFYRWHRHSGRNREWSAHKTIFRSLAFWKTAFPVKNKELSTASQEMKPTESFFCSNLIKWNLDLHSIIEPGNYKPGLLKKRSCCYLVTSIICVARLSCLLRMSSESVKPSLVHVAYLVPRSCSRLLGT